MPKQSARLRLSPGPAHDPAERDGVRRVEYLLRQILDNSQEARRPSEDGAGEVLRVHVDGIEYALVRCQPPPVDQRVVLSPREQAIVRLIIKGYSNKTLARVLDISPWTVATHLRRIFAKLDVGSRSEMVGRVLNENLLVADTIDND